MERFGIASVAVMVVLLLSIGLAAAGLAAAGGPAGGEVLAQVEVARHLVLLDGRRVKP